jgi:hypothetical protein
MKKRLSRSQLLKQTANLAAKVISMEGGWPDKTLVRDENSLGAFGKTKSPLKQTSLERGTRHPAAPEGIHFELRDCNRGRHSPFS